MAFQRGDIIMVYFDLPYSESSDSHPAIIISNDDVFEQDGLYICVMMSSTTKNIDKYSFEVTQEMLVNKNNKDYSQVRCHLITNVDQESIRGGKINSMKKNSVDQLVIRISDITLSV
ncbi:type II toxin-antitoxin system PemK/MazF family toxin [Flavobacterium sp. ZB4R12]|uniref:type II toxin-antitoxin system PemK/MazF family toxin n=1 Tax=unclassified Flavobacterium TaxID=196869 RepID=UPI003AAEE58B